MLLTGKEDLRVQKTMEAIRSAFEQLILEKQFEKITVTELCARARINKKTFYHYYADLNALLAEYQQRISQAYIFRVGQYRLPQNADKIIREFLLFSEEQGEVYEKITCDGSFDYIRGQMIKKVCENTPVTQFQQTVAGVFMEAALLEIYKFWIKGGKAIPLEEIINNATALICNGLNGY